MGALRLQPLAAPAKNKVLDELSHFLVYELVFCA